MLCTLQDIKMQTKDIALNLQFLLPNQLFFLKISVVCISYTLVTVQDWQVQGCSETPKLQIKELKLSFLVLICFVVVWTGLITLQGRGIFQYKQKFQQHCNTVTNVNKYVLKIPFLTMPAKMCVYFQDAEECMLTSLVMWEYTFFHKILVQSSFMELNNGRPHMP